MNRLVLSSTLATCAASVFAAAPVVSDVVATQDAASRKVTVSYNLADAPAVITLSVETNSAENGWVSIGEENLSSVAGDANMVVEPGRHTLTWAPNKAWPDQKIDGGRIRIGAKAWAVSAPPDYMVVSLVEDNYVRYYTSSSTVPSGVTADVYKTEKMVFRKIPAAGVTWRMGSLADEIGRQEGREVPHTVTLADDYYMGVYEVTQRQYELLMGEKWSKTYFTNAKDYAMRPVDTIGFCDIRGTVADGADWPNDGHGVKPAAFVGVLRNKTNLIGFDLPTEAQWEYACRAGSGGGYCTGEQASDAALRVLGRYKSNGGYVNGSKEPSADCTGEYGTAKVGSYLPNAWGLYDMHGNIMEWCLDWFEDSLEGVNPEFGPRSSSVGKRVTRGGNWSMSPNYERCAYRNEYTPNYQNKMYGFRMAYHLNTTVNISK